MSARIGSREWLREYGYEAGLDGTPLYEVQGDLAQHGIEGDDARHAIAAWRAGRQQRQSERPNARRTRRTHSS